MPFHSIELNSVTPTSEFRIENKGEFPTDFTISRLNDNLGSTKPLSWIKFDLCKTYSDDGKSCTAFEGRPTALEPLIIKDVPAGKTIILQVSGGDGKPLTTRNLQWQHPNPVPELWKTRSRY
ncbi:MAG: hypothetical protein H6728_01490 [Myxococcales bacterium]|nr:hypothetical protein [Myxococcales bacterium]